MAYAGTPFDWEEAQLIARSVSYQVARSFPGISPEDIEQSIMLSVAQRESTFRRIGYSPESMRTVFRKYGQEYANNERISAMTFSDQYHYTTAEVRTLLSQALFDPEVFHESLDDIPEIMTRFDDIMARVVDLQTAYNRLGQADQDIIRKRFIDGAVLSPAEAKASQRAVNRLALAINRGISLRSYERATGQHDGPGGRKAMSNARAAWLTKAELNGDDDHGTGSYV